LGTGPGKLRFLKVSPQQKKTKKKTTTTNEGIKKERYRGRKKKGRPRGKDSYVHKKQIRYGEAKGPQGAKPQQKKSTGKPGKKQRKWLGRGKGGKNRSKERKEVFTNGENWAFGDTTTYNPSNRGNKPKTGKRPLQTPTDEVERPAEL